MGGSVVYTVAFCTQGLRKYNNVYIYCTMIVPTIDFLHFSFIKRWALSKCLLTRLQMRIWTARGGGGGRHNFLCFVKTNIQNLCITLIDTVIKYVSWSNSFHSVFVVVCFVFYSDLISHWPKEFPLYVVVSLCLAYLESVHLSDWVSSPLILGPV